jgi:hypothetical protein
MVDFLKGSACGFAFSKQTPPKANHLPARIGLSGAGGASIRRGKKQGRRRSIPPTTLPAPDIEIGLRHPVNCTMAEPGADECDPVHNRNKIVAAGPQAGHKLRYRVRDASSFIRGRSVGPATLKKLRRLHGLL